MACSEGEGAGQPLDRCEAYDVPNHTDEKDA